MKREGDLHPPILPLQLVQAGYAVAGAALLEEISLAIPAGRRLILMGANGAGKKPVAAALPWPDQADIRKADLGEWRGAPAGPGDGVPAPRAAPALGRGQSRLSPAAAWHGPRRLPGDRHADAGALRARRPRRPPPRACSPGASSRRLALARAWTMRPQILFLDEPTSALDPSATRTIEAMIESFSAEGITIVMSTHNLGQARRLAQDIAFLHRGRLIEHGPADIFFRGAQSPGSARFPGGRPDLVRAIWRKQ